MASLVSSFQHSCDTPRGPAHIEDQHDAEQLDEMDEMPSFDHFDFHDDQQDGRKEKDEHVTAGHGEDFPEECPDPFTRFVHNEWFSSASLSFGGFLARAECRWIEKAPKKLSQDRAHVLSI